MMWIVGALLFTAGYKLAKAVDRELWEEQRKDLIRRHTIYSEPVHPDARDLAAEYKIDREATDEEKVLWVGSVCRRSRR